jgi:hypothetical protein
VVLRSVDYKPWDNSLNDSYQVVQEDALVGPAVTGLRPLPRETKTRPHFGEEVTFERSMDEVSGPACSG